MFTISIRLLLAFAICLAQLSLPSLAAESCPNTSAAPGMEITEKQFHVLEKKFHSPTGIAGMFHNLRLLVADKYRQPGKQTELHSMSSNGQAIETRVIGNVVNVGVIIVHDISQQNADALFNNAMTQLIDKSEITKLVLDLRNCSQAEFGNVINISEQCLNGDDNRPTVDINCWVGNHNIYQTFYQRTSDLYVRTIDRTANTINNQYFRRWPNRSSNLSFAVITNGHTFSGSEILVAALREHNRVQLFGQATGGNCDCAVYMQSGRYVYRARDEYFYSPNGNCLGSANGPCTSNAGIKPDVLVNDAQNTPSDDPQTDPSLKAAIDWLKTQPTPTKEQGNE